MTIPHPFLVSVIALALVFPIARWLTNRATRALNEHDAALDRIDRERIAASAGWDDATVDPLDQIEALLNEEVALIHEILDERFRGEPVMAEHAAALRQAHRRGMAARRRCGDPMLDTEMGWLQGFGSFALMADLSEHDQTELDGELRYRTNEVRQALALHRGRVLDGSNQPV